MNIVLIFLKEILGELSIDFSFFIVVDFFIVLDILIWL